MLSADSLWNIWDVKFYLQKQDVTKHPFSLGIKDFRLIGL